LPSKMEGMDNGHREYRYRFDHLSASTPILILGRSFHTQAYPIISHLGLPIPHLPPIFPPPCRTNFRPTPASGSMSSLQTYLDTNRCYTFQLVASRQQIRVRTMPRCSIKRNSTKFTNNPLDRGLRNFPRRPRCPIPPRCKVYRTRRQSITQQRRTPTLRPPSCLVSCMPRPVECTLCPVGCTLCPVGCTLCPAGCTLCPAGCTLCPAGCTLCPAGFMLRLVGSSLESSRPLPQTTR
jgi:hypothetical protein